MNEANNSNQNSIGEQEVVSIDSDIQSSSTKTKGRGATRGVGLEKYVQVNGPIRIRIDFEDRKPICKDSSKLNSQIGKEVRAIVPLECEHRSDVSKEVKREIVDRLSNYFILDLNEPLVQDYLEHEMSVLYRDFRCSLHKSYKKYDSPAEARKHRDKRVARDSDWAHFKSRSEANSKARSKLPFTHRGGTSTFLRHKQKMKEKGKEDEMVELKTTSSQEGSEPLLEREICDRVLGKRSGHVKGQGWGPRPKNARNETIQHNTKEANAQIAHLQSIVESQQATIEAILRRLSCPEATSNMERSSEQSNDSQQADLGGTNLLNILAPKAASVSSHIISNYHFCLLVNLFSRFDLVFLPSLHASFSMIH
uniref:CACTA en-spm transposon protein n=1 Tax=Cucumis melo TaxID=3656 RepID=A0A9I9E4Z5_CUCME